MLNVFWGYSFCLLTAAVVILGDYSLKLAADDQTGATVRLIVTGTLLYSISALLWFFAMRHIGLAQAGVAYSMLTLIALCAIGYLVFDEPIKTRETLGIACAFLSMILLVRVA